MVKWIFVFLIILVVLLLYIYVQLARRLALVNAWEKHTTRLATDPDSYEKYFTVTFYYYGYYRFRGYEVVVSPTIHESQSSHLIGESTGLDLFDEKGRKVV